MAGPYDSAIALAKRLIAAKGKDIQLRRLVPGAFDPESGTDATATTESQTVRAVVLPASGGKIAALDRRFGTADALHYTYAFAYIAGAGLTFAPDAGQTAIIDSTEYTILGVTPLHPNEGGLAIMYDVALRR